MLGNEIKLCDRLGKLEIATVEISSSFSNLISSIFPYKVTNILQVRKIIIHKIVPNVFFIVGYNIV
jgi:hypothetical protein